MYADTQALAESLLCVGQTQTQTPRAPHQTPHDPSVRPPAAASSQQQQQQKPVKFAELVDGYQLHIRGDALDALQSPVCVNAQASPSSCPQSRFAVLQIRLKSA